MPLKKSSSQVTISREREAEVLAQLRAYQAESRQPGTLKPEFQQVSVFRYLTGLVLLPILIIPILRGSEWPLRWFFGYKPEKPAPEYWHASAPDNLNHDQFEPFDPYDPNN